MKTLARYRCTRNQPYINPNCPGFSDRKQREGYYIWAKDSKAAHDRMVEKFPNDMYGFTVNRW